MLEFFARKCSFWLALFVAVVFLACGTKPSDSLNSALSAQSSEDIRWFGGHGSPEMFDFSFLSSSAQAVLQRFKNVRKSLRAAKQAICPRDQALMKAIHAEFGDIRKQSFDREAKRAKKRAVFAKYGSQLKADRNQFQACALENASAIGEVIVFQKSLKRSCFVLGGRGHHKFGAKSMHGGRGMGKRHFRRGEWNPANWSEESKAELEAKLTSGSCAATIAKVESELP